MQEVDQEKDKNIQALAQENQDWNTKVQQLFIEI